jgi:homopolymeric O-antigen transport system permease protein
MSQSSIPDLPTPQISWPAAPEMPWPAAPSNATIAWTDIRDGFGKSWFWGALAMQDIKLRYRGSMIGPFWMTLTMAIQVVAMGLIYAKLFHQDTTTYLPFLTVGIITWTYVSSQITEGCQTFMAAQSLIQTVPLPFSVHAYRQVARNLIMLAHNLAILPPVIIFYHVPFTWRILETLPALVLLSLNGVWVCIFFGIISARYRDIPPIVQNFVTIVFFVTPIFWTPSSLGRWQGVAQLNPLFAAVDIIRAPVMGQSTAPYSWALMLGVTVIGCSVAFMLFSRFRSRIVYWI